jgi:hypothetical protein
MALTVLPGVARRSVRVLAVRGVPKLAVQDAQRQCAREILMGQRRRAAERLTVAGPREDSHALPEAADSNLVWGQPCLQPPAAQPQPAQMQAEALPQAVSSRQVHATPPTLAVAPKRPGAAQRASLLLSMEPLLVLQAPRAEPARPLLVWFRQGSVQHLWEERAEELLPQSLERLELESPAGVAEEPRLLVSCEPPWLRLLSRLCPKPFFPRQQIPPPRLRGNVAAP